MPLHSLADIIITIVWRRASSQRRAKPIPEPFRYNAPHRQHCLFRHRRRIAGGRYYPAAGVGRAGRAAGAGCLRPGIAGHRPTVQSPTFSGTPRLVYHKSGDSIRTTVKFDRAVMVSGRPQLELDVGAHQRRATYGRGFGSGNLKFACLTGCQRYRRYATAAQNAVAYTYTVTDGNGDSNSLSFTIKVDGEPTFGSDTPASALSPARRRPRSTPVITPTR